MPHRDGERLVQPAVTARDRPSRVAGRFRQAESLAWGIDRGAQAWDPCSMTLTAAEPYHVLARSRERIVAAAEAAPTAHELFKRVSTLLTEVVPFSISGWFAADPETLLPSWPSRIENGVRGLCDGYWERECTVDDALLYRDLAVSARRAGGLQKELDGLVMRSTRYREVLAPHGIEDELRAVLRTGDSTWGVITLLRRDEASAFSADEVRFVDSLSRPIAEAMRSKLVGRHASQPAVQEPGLLTFSASHRLLSSNDAAHHWLAQLPDYEIEPEVPTALNAVLGRARAIAIGRARGGADVRVQSLGGRWLTLRATALRDTAGAVTAYAVTIEPANPSHVTTILAEVYGLSARELQVANRLVRGESTATIAGGLFLSEHTVRDHVKSMLAKIGVSSRAELVAHLFFEMSEDPNARDVVSA